MDARMNDEPRAAREERIKELLKQAATQDQPVDDRMRALQLAIEQDIEQVIEDLMDRTTSRVRMIADIADQTQQQAWIKERAELVRTLENLEAELRRRGAQTTDRKDQVGPRNEQPFPDEDYIGVTKKGDKPATMEDAQAIIDDNRRRQEKVDGHRFDKRQPFYGNMTRWQTEVVKAITGCSYVVYGIKEAGSRECLRNKILLAAQDECEKAGLEFKEILGNGVGIAKEVIDQMGPAGTPYAVAVARIDESQDAFELKMLIIRLKLAEAGYYTAGNVRINLDGRLQITTTPKRDKKTARWMARQHKKNTSAYA